MNANRIRSVTIVGGGTAGWMAAAVLARTLGQRLDITLVESDAIGTVGVGEATIPQIRLLNALLGVDEHRFLSATRGTFKLGIEFDGWRAPGERYLHAFGTIGQSQGMLPFYPYWLRARVAGDTHSLWDYSLNAVAARNHRYGHLDAVPGTALGPLVRAYHFDAGRYAALLRELAESNSVRRIEGRVGEVRCDHEGHIREIQLEDGRRVGGDLFIDCSGFRALLMRELGVGYEDWRHWLPCDRAVAVGCERTDPLLPYTRAVAHDAGWQWRIPLQHRTGNGYVFCSEFLSEEDATRALLARLDGAPHGTPRVLRFETGRRTRFWSGNCVALGLAAGFLEPLESTSIHLVQSGLSRLLALFPAEGLQAAEIEAYNRQTAREWEQVRDFLILHYHANGREEPFWQARRATPLPESLVERLAVFQSNGRLFRDGEELFTEVGWLQVLLGQGIEPRGYDPMADNPTADQLDRFLVAVRTAVEGAVDALPDHAAFIAATCRASVQDENR